MKKIKLTQNQVALVDDEDYKILNQHKWHAAWNSRNGTYYAVRDRKIQDGPGKQRIFMHCEILSSPGKETDHRNRNTLDNQRQNLRLCTDSQNSCNRRKTIKNTSGYKGVSWDRQKGKWRATVRVKGRKRVDLGFFKKNQDAFVEYVKAASELHGEFASFF